MQIKVSFLQIKINMRKFLKVFAFVILGGILSTSLSACRLPFTDKEITLPFFEKKPDVVMDKMSEEMDKVEQFKIKTNLVADIDFNVEVDDDWYDEDWEFDILATYKSDAKMRNIGEGEEVDVEVEQNMYFEADLGDMVFKFDADTIALKEKQYLRMNIVPTFFKFILGTGVKGKWFEIETTEDEEDDFMEFLNDFFGGDAEEGKEKFDKLVKNIEDYLDKNDLIVIEERLHDEKVNDVKCYHYATKVDKNTTKEIKKMMWDFMKEETFLEELKDDDEFEDLEDFVEQLDKVISDIDVELWVGKKDFYLHKMKFKFKLDFSELEMPEDFDEIKLDITADVNGEFEFYDMNKEVIIEEPEDAQSFTEFIEEREEKMMGGPRKKSRNAKRISDVKQMQTAVELYYNDHDKYPKELIPGESLEGEDEYETRYMYYIPMNPLPSEGECEADFEYSYQVKDEGQSYELKYCVSEDVAGISEGHHTATPAGISE